VSYKKQELHTLRDHQASFPVFGGLRVAIYFLIFSVVIVVLFVFVLCLVYPILPVFWIVHS